MNQKLLDQLIVNLATLQSLRKQEDVAIEAIYETVREIEKTPTPRPV